MVAEVLTSTTVIEFIEQALTLSGDYSGQPFLVRPWQAAIIRSIYDDERVTDCGIWLPRKNAKTELATALAAFELFCNPREGEIYSAAGEREQAGIIFRKLAGMVRRCPALAARAKIIDSQKRIINTKTGTLFWSLSAEDGTKHGYNPSMVIGDEIHVWKRRDLWTALTTGSDTRRQKLFLTITTAGTWDDASLETELYEYACKVRDGVVVDPTYIPVIYEAPADADPWDEDVWRECNPALGDFRMIDGMHKLAERAKHNARLENDFRRLYLNQHTQQTTRWLRKEHWDACGPLPDAPHVAYGGLDLSATTDLTAWAVVMKRRDGRAVPRQFFIPEARAKEIERVDRVPYDQWRRDGWVTFTPGEVIDYEFVHKQILDDVKKYKIRTVGYDPWNAEQSRQVLEKQGVNCVQVRQGVASLSAPCKELERCVIAGTLDHGHNPVSSWCMSNIEVQTDANGNIRPVKPAHNQRTKKIDGLVAAIIGMAVGMADSRFASPYETRGVMTL